MTTNRTSGTFANGEFPAWDSTAKMWTNSGASFTNLSLLTNIVNNIVNTVVTNIASNAAVTVILTATNFEESYTFHLDWKNGVDATAKPNDPRFPWKTPTNVVAAMRTYINNGTNYLKLVGRPGVYTNAHFTSASGGVSVAGPLWFSPTNVVWDLEGVEFYNPNTNECNTILITNANNFIIHGLTLRSTRQSGTTNDRSGVLHGAIQIAGTAKRLKFDRMTFTNYTRHCVTPAAGFISESTVYEDCQFWNYGATNTADFMGIDGQAIPLLANTLVRGCYFYDGTRGLETEGFIAGAQNSFGAIVENCTFNRISEASILIIPDFTPQNYFSVMIRDCFFNGAGMDFPYAVVSRGGQRIRILDNYISDYYTGIMLEADATVNYLTQIKGNTVYLTDRPILCLDNQNEVDAIYKADITDNIIHGGTEFGMYLNINNSVVENNTITEVTAKGIWLAGNTTVNDPCQDNVIRNNQIWETDGTGLFIEATVLNTRVENNIISGSTTADYNFNGATNVSEIWHTITGVGINTNVPGKAFHLSKGGMRLDGLTGSGSVLALGNNNDVYLTNIVGGSGTPGGTNMQVQFNQAGSFGGATNVWYDLANQRLGIGTQNPFSILHVDGDTILDGLLTVSNDVQFMSPLGVTNFITTGTSALFFPAGGVTGGQLRVGNPSGKSWFYDKSANQMKISGSGGQQTFMVDGSAGNTFISGSLDVTNWTHLTGALTNTGAATFENSSVSMANLPGSGNYVGNSNGFLIFTNAPSGVAGSGMTNVVDGAGGPSAIGSLSATNTLILKPPTDTVPGNIVIANGTADDFRTVPSFWFNITNGSLYVPGDITATGAVISVGSPPLLLLRSTNLVGAIGWTLPSGDYQPTNVHIMNGSNFSGGQIWAVASVSGNEVTWTNGPAPTGSGGSSTNFDNITVTNVARFTGRIDQPPATAIYTGTNVWIDVATNNIFSLLATNSFAFIFTNSAVAATNGAVDMMRVEIRITQGPTGFNTFATNNPSTLKFGGSIGGDITGITLSTNAGAIDYTTWRFCAPSNMWHAVGIIRGGDGYR